VSAAGGAASPARSGLPAGARTLHRCPPGMKPPRRWASVSLTSPLSRSRASRRHPAANRQGGEIWLSCVWAEEAQTRCARCRALVKRWLRAGPHPAQLAQEQLNGHRPPARQHIQGQGQFWIGVEALGDHGGLPAVTLADHLGQGLQPVRGPEVVAGVTALIEVADQVIGRYVARLADPYQANLRRALRRRTLASVRP
jgi:hypothetical protein